MKCAHLPSEKSVCISEATVELGYPTALKTDSKEWEMSTSRLYIYTSACIKLICRVQRVKRQAGLTQAGIKLLEKNISNLSMLVFATLWQKEKRLRS